MKLVIISYCRNMAMPHASKLKYTQVFNSNDRHKRGHLTGNGQNIMPLYYQNQKYSCHGVNIVDILTFDIFQVWRQGHCWFSQAYHSQC